MTSSRPRESIRSGLGLLLGLLALLTLLVPLAVQAHLGHAVEAAERYLKVDFEAGRVRVVVSLMLGPGEAARVLRLADREDGDGDGTLTPAEADAYLARWGVGLRQDLVLEIDGAAVPVDWGEAYLDPPGPIRMRPATVEMIARIPLTAGEHHLVLRDAMRRDSFERTDVAFSAHEGAELIASGSGEERPTARVPAIAFAGAQGPSVFSAVARVEGGPMVEAPSMAEGDPSVRRWGSWALAAAVAITVVWGGVYLRIRRRR